MTTRNAQRVVVATPVPAAVAAAVALVLLALLSGCSAPPTPPQRGHYLSELEQSLGAERFEAALTAAHAGLAQTPHADDPARAEEHLRLGGAAALAALGRDTEAVQLLRPLYSIPGMASLQAETLAVLVELELRATAVAPALCAIEVLHQQRGLEYETLRTAGILYRALGEATAAQFAEAAASELAHAYSAGPVPDLPPMPSAPGEERTSSVDCSAYGGVAARAGLDAYQEYRNYSQQGGQLTGPELDRYAALEPVLHRFPGYYMGLVATLRELLPEYRLSTVRPLLERAILLSPRGPHALVARREIGRLLGLGDADGERILLALEIEDIASRLSVSRVPETVAPVVELLATPDNPYRSAGRVLLVQALEMPGMRGYLEARRDGAEGELRRALELLLATS